MHALALILQDASSGVDPATVRHMVVAMMAIMPLIILIFLAIVIIPCWFICKKAGFSPWLSLLNIIPAGNLILLYVLAFAEWKVMPVQQVIWQPPPVPPPAIPPQA